MATISVGVEEQDQLAFLVSQGCDMIQEFLIGRPMHTDEIGKFLEHQKNQITLPAVD